MRKIKLLFFAIGILLSVGSDVTKPNRLSCVGFTQYYYDGFNYVEITGQIGYDYYCDNGETCTYYKPNPIWQPNKYVPCRDGAYTEILLKK